MQWKKLTGINVLVFKKNKIKTKKCNVGLELDLQHDKKKINWKFIYFMTSAQKISDQELAQFGWVESIATNSISDFNSPKIDVEEQTTNEKESDLIDTFICHMIFYVVFCYSLFLYVFVDLGFGSFIKNKVNTLFKLQKKFDTPSFISALSN